MYPGYPKPLVTSQSPQKVSIHANCAASEAPEKKIEGNKNGVGFLGILLF